MKKALSTAGLVLLVASAAAARSSGGTQLRAAAAPQAPAHAEAATIEAHAPVHVGQAPAGSAGATTGAVERGRQLFLAHQCFACHGYNGETGTRLLQEDGTFVPRLLTVRSFIAFIRAPRPAEPPPIGSSTTMPSYGVSSLPDEQAAELFAYIRTFKSTQPALKDIPLLSRMLQEGGKAKP